MTPHRENSPFPIIISRQGFSKIRKEAKVIFLFASYFLKAGLQHLEQDLSCQFVLGQKI